MGFQKISLHRDFYRESIQNYSPGDVRSLRWNSEQSQKKRFWSLLRTGLFKGSSVLDVGCGQGDFLSYLKEKGQIPSSYTGIDLMPEFIEIAQKNHPEAVFQTGDFFDTVFENPFDFLVCNGALNLKEENNMRLLYKMILKSQATARKAVGITLLRHAPFFENDPRIFHYQEREVRSLAEKLGLNHRIYTDYAENDFTLILNP